MIETHGLTKHFSQRSGRQKREPVEAVKGIDLQVAEGELIALLGPNGAGKSTTLRMLTTLLPATAGTAVVAGCDIARDPAGVRRRIGYIGQGNGAGHAQRARDEVVTQARIYGQSHRDAIRRTDELLESLQLEGVRDRLVSTLSGGQRRRLDIALGMVHRPELLFLDEPSTGLDPQNRANLQGEIERLRVRHGTTIVLTTHYLDEADALSDRVVVIDHGRLIADDTPERLKADLAGDHMKIVASEAGGTATIAETIRRVAEVRELEVSGTTVDARVNEGAEVLPRLMVDLHDAGIGVQSAEVSRPTLDDVFLALTGRSLRDGGDPEASDDEPAHTSEDQPSEDRPSTLIPAEQSS